MSDPTLTLLSAADPAKDRAAPPAPLPAAALIALAEAGPASRYPRRRLLVTAAAAAVATAGAGVYAWQKPATPLTGQTHRPLLGPVIEPVSLQYGYGKAAGDELRALADRIGAAEYETATGTYTYIHTARWNAVFDDDPSGNTQIIRPQDHQLWYRADGSGRITVTPMAPAYPNDASMRYYAARNPGPADTTPRTDDLPAGKAGPHQPPPANWAATLGSGPDVLSRVSHIYDRRLVPRAARAALLRHLASLDRVSWRGETKDQLGRPGVAISVTGEAADQVLILDKTTGVPLAWNEIERPHNTPAGATLYLAHTRVNTL